MSKAIPWTPPSPPTKGVTTPPGETLPIVPPSDTYSVDPARAGATSRPPSTARPRRRCAIGT